MEKNSQTPQTIHTAGGAAILGDVHLADGDFVGRDKNIFLTGEVAYDVRGLANPYLGLRSFLYTDHAAYAGRDAEIAQAVNSVTAPGKQQVLYFVTGASGSGKSSFVQAGLLPALERFYAARGQTTARAVFRPGDAPMTMLADALLQVGAPVVEAYLSLPGVPLIVLDQFEELFTQANAGERQHLVQWLLALPPFAQRPAHLIATLRADYLDQLFEIKPLYDLSKGGMDLRVMTVDQLKEAIQKPLWVRAPNGEKRFEAALLDRLAQEASESATLLPLLQVTLEEIWKKGTLTNGAYVNLADAIRLRADQVLNYHDYDQPTPEQRRSDEERAAILDTFLDLVNVSLDDDFRRDVRTSREKRLLPAAKQRLIDDLSHARLVSVSSDGSHDQPVESVTIIHEALINNWARLRTEVQERRQQLQQRARFEQQVKEWVTNARSDDYLLTGVYLAQARELARKQDIALIQGVARDFLSRSVDVNETEQRRRVAEAEARAEAEHKAAEAERQRAQEAEARVKVEHENVQTRRRQWFIGAGLALALLTAIGLGLLWNQQRQSARFLQSYNVAAQALPIANEQPDRAILLAMEASEIQQRSNRTDTSAVKSTLLTAMLAGPRPLRYLRGHTKPVVSVAFSADSRWLASASNDATIRLWELPTGQNSYTLTGHIGPVHSLAFYPAGEDWLLASGGEDGAVRLWDWPQSQQAPTSSLLTQRDQPVQGISFSPDGTYLAIASGHQIELWSMAGRRRQSILTGHTGIIYGLAFNRDGSRLVSTDGKNDLRLWDVNTGQPLDKTNPQADDYGQEWMHSVVFDPTGESIITGYGYDTGSTDPLGGSVQDNGFVRHTSLIRAMAFNHEGSRFVTASEDWRIGYCYIYPVPYNNPARYQCQNVGFLKGHNSPVNAVAFSPDDRWLASGGDDGNVLLWNAYFPYVSQTLAAPIDFDNHRPNVAGLAFSPDSKIMAAAYWDTALRLWDMKSKTLLKEIWPNQGTLGRVAFHPDGKRLAVATQLPPLVVWQIDGVAAQTLPINTGFNSVSFSADGQWLAFDNDDTHSLCLWDMVQPIPRCYPVAAEDAVDRVAFSPHDNHLLVTNAGHKVILWDLSTQPPITHTLGAHDSGIYGFAFTSDGKLLASAGRDYTVRVWNLETRQWLQTLHNSGRFAQSVAFSPDDKMLVAANEDWSVRWWDVATWEPLVPPFQIRFERLDSLAFSPNGRWLATGSFDGLIDLWPGVIDAWKQTACAIVNRNLTPTEWQLYMGSEPYQAVCR